MCLNIFKKKFQKIMSKFEVTWAYPKTQVLSKFGDFRGYWDQHLVQTRSKNITLYNQAWSSLCWEGIILSYMPGNLGLGLDEELYKTILFTTGVSFSSMQKGSVPHWTLVNNVMNSPKKMEWKNHSSSSCFTHLKSSKCCYVTPKSVKLRPPTCYSSIIGGIQIESSNINYI